MPTRGKALQFFYQVYSYKNSDGGIIILDTKYYLSRDDAQHDYDVRVSKGEWVELIRCSFEDCKDLDDCSR